MKTQRARQIATRVGILLLGLTLGGCQRDKLSTFDPADNQPAITDELPDGVPANPGTSDESDQAEEETPEPDDNPIPPQLCEPLEVESPCSATNPRPGHVAFRDPVKIFAPADISAAVTANHSLVGQFTDDCLPDIAVFFSEVDGETGGLAVYAGDGAGAFSHVSTVSLGGTIPRRAVAADLNGDGAEDLVAYCTASDGTALSLEVLLRTASGFTRAGTYPMPGMARTAVTLNTPISAGDVDGDGDIDIAAAAMDTFIDPGVFEPDGLFYVRVLSNRGDATFDASDPLTELENATDVILDHFDDDSELDLALTTTTSLHVYRGGGDLTFEPASQNPFGISADYPEMILAGDFNNDGKEDLRTIHESCYDSVYEGEGDGTFRDPVVYYTTKDPTLRAAAGDFDGDSTVELALVGLGTDITFLAIGADGNVVAEVDSDSQLGVKPVFGTEGDWELHMFLDMNISAGDVNQDGFTDLVFGPRANEFEITSGLAESEERIILNLLIGDRQDWCGG